jgi:cytochrome c oxidase subunit 2
MLNDLPLFPRAASTAAAYVDALYLFMVAVCGLVSVLIWIVVIYSALKYRRKHAMEIPPDEEAPQWLEMAWTIIPFIIFMGMFVWGSWVYFFLGRPPKDALDIYVTGKQWMWKFQHVGGQSEINSLHVPVGRNVRLIMASEDVIHSFFAPEFRVKTDVLPNRYTYTWFKATKSGKYHLFCTEYCGTEHSGMIGSIYVMEPAEYETWLAGGVQDTPANAGKKLFSQYACDTCHTGTASARGPVLAGLYGTQVQLQDGRTVNADENYIRESILNPQAKIVAGFQPIMPTFRGQVNEQQLIQLIAYLKSLTPPAPAATQPGGGAPTAGNPAALRGPTQSGSSVNTETAFTTTGGEQ